MATEWITPGFALLVAAINPILILFIGAILWIEIRKIHRRFDRVDLNLANLALKINQIDGRLEKIESGPSTALPE